MNRSEAKVSEGEGRGVGGGEEGRGVGARVELYEKIWMWGAAGLVVVFIGAVVYTAAAGAVHPPSHVETIDPQTARTDPRFASPGVTERPDGTVEVVLLAQMYAFLPTEIRVPAGRPVTFRMTSPDVIHGFQVVGTNANAMVMPGYVTEFTVTFPQPGEHLIVCNEYCGLGHHVMHGKLVVEGEAP
ncbi:MAG: cytochrome c oxidase subunit II [Gemmatimonadetes bacterium]|nr:cytochrome c oxidase subunit II [Gemmatimonadota bacterium]